MELLILFSWLTTMMTAAEDEVSVTGENDGHQRSCDFFDFNMTGFLLVWCVVEVSGGGGEIKTVENCFFVDEFFFLK